MISELRWVRLIPGKIQKQLFSKFTLIYLFCFVGTMFSQSQLLSCDATAAEKKLKVKHPLVGDRIFFFFKGRACKCYVNAVQKKLNRFVVLSICLL